MNRTKPVPVLKKQPKAPQTKEFFKLRYLKFKCRDMNRTIDFYKSLGMTLDFDGDQESFRHISGSLNLNQKLPRTMDSSHLKKNTVLKEVEKVEEDKEGGHCGRIFGFSFATHGTSIKDKYQASNKVSLFFEEDVEFFLEEQVKKVTATVKPAEETMKQVNQEKKNDTPIDEKKKREYEYLVVYVHFLQRLVKRMESKGFELLLDITSFDGIKIAIIRDPNNIQVRLMELPDTSLNESSQKNWFAKLGYYTLASSNADASVLMYESLFQTQIQKQTQKLEKEKNMVTSMDDKEIQNQNIRKIGPAQTVKQALAKGNGFRLVDMEEFVVGLTDSVFYWMGNDMRAASCSLCITEVSNADTGLAFTYHDPQKSPLKAIGTFVLRIGFEVASIDYVINKLKYDTKDGLLWDPLRYRMAKVGVAARFIDKLNGVYFEIFNAKIDVPNANKGPTSIRQGRLPALPVKTIVPKEPDVKDENEFVIHLNHLKGHARVLSEGAINSSKGFGYLLQKEVPTLVVEEPLMKNQRKKLIAAFLDTPAHSMANLTSMVNLSSKRNKTKDELIMEQFVSREKSKSV